MITKRKIFKFDFKFLFILLLVLIGSQLILTFHSKNAFHSFLINTQEWYQNFSVKRIANLTSTSLELLIETKLDKEEISPTYRNKIINGLDIIFSQNIMEKNADEMCLLLYSGNKLVALDNGKDIFGFLQEDILPLKSFEQYPEVKKIFEGIKDELINLEKIQIKIIDEKVFHVFVPFVPDGEFIGALYMKITPNLAPISEEFLGSYNSVSLIYIILISSGLFLIYIVFSITLRDRDKAYKSAYEEHENFIKEKIDREKESTFTMRIYQAYHKSEKMIGFINNDLENLKEENINEIKDRVSKYSNFIGRVIYDMKYYDPPIHSIINPLFSTDINEVINFIIKNLFLRVYAKSDVFKFSQEYDASLPKINVNEYVIWEIVEPIIQNSITHNSDRQVNVFVSTKYDKENDKIILTIADNGKGIAEELLIEDMAGIQSLFHENATKKTLFGGNSGYGCYIAHTMAVKYCGWKMKAENITPNGCKFTIEISLITNRSK